MEFTELPLYPDLHRGISKAGYKLCTPVQEQVISIGLSGKDLYVQSQTGTGKTAAFLIVIFQRLLSDPLLNGRKALIMVPTRELAVQVEEEAKQLGAYLPYHTASFYGGVGYTEQKLRLKEEASIMIGTPGRVLDLNHSGLMNLMDIAFLVIDEADRMFDMGFYPDLRKLVTVISPADRRQTMLFSATLITWVKNLAWEYTQNPAEITIEPETVTLHEAEQILYHVHSDDKMRLLLGILQQEKPKNVLIFCNTKRFTQIIAERLADNGYPADFISGDIPQSKRLSVIEDIKAGKLRYLVATDVAARGLDIEDLALVINYDLPSEAANYVHRIGRTARAGKSGKAISLVSEQDVYGLPAIERFIEKKITAFIANETLFAPLTTARHGLENKREQKQEKRVVKKESGKPQKRTAQKKQTKAGAGAPDLSKLSFEQRMAYYQKKYGEAPKKADLPVMQSTAFAESAQDHVKQSAPAQDAPKVAQEPVKKGVIARILKQLKLKNKKGGV